jgi:hypothetical protein
LLFSHIQNNQNAYIQNYSSTQNSYRDIFFLGSRITFETTASNFLNRIQVLTAFSTGNVAINTTTDAGFRLDVNGTARVSGNTTITGTIAIGSSSTLNLTGGINSNLIQGTQTIEYRSGGSSINRAFHNFTNSLSFNPTADFIPHVNMAATFAPTSGTGTYAQLYLYPTINQTGGANGITRGLYIAPTLTSAADFRAIETTAGKVIFNGDNAANVQAGYNLMLKGGNPRLRIEGGTAGTSLADAVIQFADSAGDNWIIKTNRANGNLVFGLGWNNSVTNIVTLGSTSIQPSLGVTGISSSTGTALSVQNSSLSSLLTVLNTGNVLIGTATDAGFKLDVNGTARVSDLTIGTASFDNNVRFGNNNTRIFNSTSDNSLNYQSVFSSTTVHRFRTNSDLPNANTSGNNVFLSLPIGFAPTSGTGTWAQLSMTPTINQTGTASGAVRGIYYNPTLTSVLGIHYAFHSTSGRVRLEGLPTSPTGLSAGDLWNNGGVINIV